MSLPPFSTPRRTKIWTLWSKRVVARGWERCGESGLWEKE